MKKSTLKASLLALLICTSIGLTSCGKSDSNSAGASQADIDALTLIAGKDFASLRTEEHEDTEGSSFSTASEEDTLEDGTEFTFRGTTLTTNDNKVVYASNEYTLDFIITDGDQTYTNFKRIITETETEGSSNNLQISTGDGMTCNIQFTNSYIIDGTSLEGTLEANGTITYAVDDTTFATVEISDARIQVESNGSQSHLNISMPFVLTINSLQYTGTFKSIQTQIDGEYVSGDEFTKATLKRNGDKVGEIHIDNDGKFKVYIQNDNGDLEELIVD